MTLYTYTLNRVNKRRFRVIECCGTKIVGEIRKIAPTRVKGKGKQVILNENALRPYEIPLFLCLGKPPDKVIKAVENAYKRAAILYADADKKRVEELRKQHRKGTSNGYFRKDDTPGVHWASELKQSDAEYLATSQHHSRWHIELLDAYAEINALCDTLAGEVWIDPWTGEKTALTALDAYLEREIKRVYKYSVEYIIKRSEQISLFDAEYATEEDCRDQIAEHIHSKTNEKQWLFSVRDCVDYAVDLGLTDNAKSVKIFSDAIRQSHLLDQDVEVSNGMHYVTPTFRDNSYRHDAFAAEYKVRMSTPKRYCDTVVFRRNPELIDKLKEIFTLGDDIDTVGYAAIQIIYMCTHEKILLYAIDDKLRDLCYFHSSKKDGYIDAEYCAEFNAYLTPERVAAFTAKVKYIKDNPHIAQISEFVWNGLRQYDTRRHWHWVHSREQWESEVIPEKWDKTTRFNKEEHQRFIARNATKLLPAPS
jgi:hypothetical protein